MKHRKLNYFCPACRRVVTVIEQYQLIPPRPPRCCTQRMLKIPKDQSERVK